MKPDFSQVYQPEADTDLLLKTAMKEAGPTDRVLEVGAGSGIIAGALMGSVSLVVATDINPHAAICTKQRGVEVVRTDLMAGICGIFDLVIFNPPYLPTTPKERIDDWLEYALDGGADGTNVIRRFAGMVSEVMAPSGRLLVLVSSLNPLHRVQEAFTENHLIPFIVATARTEDETLYVLRITHDLHCMRCEKKD